jgi:Na+-driven multidrug efflux pump
MNSFDNSKYSFSLGIVCLILFLLFNFPLLAIFNHNRLWNGAPILYAYIFGAWLLVIGLTFWVAERFDWHNKKKDKS